MFTFVTLTYNHEKYIIEHLESIKYQIETYAKNLKISLIISDDCSTDRTTYLIKKWIDLNENLFDYVKISVNDFNLGIVNNYISAINKINTDNYKLLAGDDLYFINNVFKILYNFDLAISKPITFNEQGLCIEETRKQTYYANNYIKNNDLFNCIKKQLKKNNAIIYAPTVFYNSNISKNIDLQNYISKYKYIEDYSTYYYLFFINNQILNIKYIDNYFVMYRTNSGITTLKKHNQKVLDSFLEESLTIRKDMNIPVNDLHGNKYFKVSNYTRYFKYVIQKKLDDLFFGKHKEYYRNFPKVIEQSKNHLATINNRANEFYKSISFEFEKE